MAKKAYMKDLAAVPLFSGCNQRELSTIASVVVEVERPDGTVLATQDEKAREAFIIVKGNVVVRRNNRKVATLGPGSVVGELGLLDRGPRTATVVAQGPVTLLVLGPREFAGLLDKVPSIATKMLATMASRIRDLDTKAYG